MASLIYSAITSLDGYVANVDGNFDWAAPDEEAHAFMNDLERPIGTYLYGRRMSDGMVAWKTTSTHADQPAVTQDFARIWQAAEKIVYSSTLEAVSSARTRIERQFDPDVVRQMTRFRPVGPLPRPFFGEGQSCTGAFGYGGGSECAARPPGRGIITWNPSGRRAP